ncbi:MAG: hypothetical protein Ta2B_19100 [Termitinemataceae bacterium]|nr:MAG: hypothetical protein Ta2B_19100 [Termitinemataceae bacterium]
MNKITAIFGKHLWGKAFFAIMALLMLFWYIGLTKEDGAQSQYFYPVTVDGFFEAPFFLDFLPIVDNVSDRDIYNYGDVGVQNYPPICYLIMYPFSKFDPKVFTSHVPKNTLGRTSGSFNAGLWWTIGLSIFLFFSTKKLFEKLGGGGTQILFYRFFPIV